MILALASCGGGDDDAGATPDAGRPDANPLIVDRGYELRVPASYENGTPMPLVVMLHGYSSFGVQNAAFLGLQSASERHGFLLAIPDGTVDADGNQFWNATDGCCNFDGSTVDDVGYILAVIDDASVRFDVDPRRVYLVGHSNGGFLAHRIACEHGDTIAAVVSLAGGQWKDPARCPAATPVHILQLHGTADETIAYDGGATESGPYPSAHDTAATWAQKNGCAGALAPAGAPLDLVTTLAGAETSREAYAGCPAAGAVELWTMTGGGHIPSFDVDVIADTLWAFLSAHPKP
jgi:polyhydroxybutyrate depolymerase